MLLQQLEAVRKIKEIRRDNGQYRYRIYQAELRNVEAEIIFNKEKKLNEIKLRKEYENGIYGEFENNGASISRLSQIRSEIKSMLINEETIETYLQSITDVYELNKQTLQKTKSELLLMEKKLERINKNNATARKLAVKKGDYQIQDDNDDCAIVKYIKKL